MSTHSTFESLRPILQTYSVLAITLAAGTNLSTTHITLPALLQSPPSTLATQWKTLFDRGLPPVVSLTLSSALGFSLLSYHSFLTPSITASGEVSNKVRNLYAVAAVLGGGLAVYTPLLMGGVNGELGRRAERGDKEEETEGLVRKWGMLNWWRGVMLLCSAGAGMWAVVVE